MHGGKELCGRSLQLETNLGVAIEFLMRRRQEQAFPSVGRGISILPLHVPKIASEFVISVSLLDLA